ncbi:OmpA family protein [Arcticibacter sp. MXS-1]|uniref:OmpA family protein n=1 Tax=Arcticibacter sp. MXS-1 TaxID=3341726 RepID=UPI0035A888FF
MKVLFSFLLLFSTLFVYSQSTSSNNKAAQRSYEQAGKYISAGDYNSALGELQNAVKADPRFAAAYQQLGDVSRKLKNYKSALTYYRKVLEIDPEFHPLTYFGLAESEMYAADYQSALQHFIKYSNSPNLSESSKKLVAKYIADCNFSVDAIKRPVEFNPVNLGRGVNTADQEYLPVVTADEERIIFTRRINNNEDFYQSVKGADGWANATYLSSNINTAAYNEGAQCISPDGLYLFFTGCNRPEGLGRCDIYLCRREGKDWSEPFNLGAPVNTAAWESQPSLTADGRSLYFVSNRAGGLGGYDIWKTDLLEGGQWSDPVNLGPNVNTPFDEHSPFIHPDNNTLYFSSNGWPGFGNRDLFFCRKDASGEWGKPVNLGYPINTAGEESGLVVSADGSTAFFASDMKGGYGGMDLYSFTLPERDKPQPVTYVKGKVIDADTKAPLDADVKITELKTNTVSFSESSEPESGVFLATMREGHKFSLSVDREGYLFHSENFSLDQNMNGKKPFTLIVPLQKIRTGGTVVMRNVFFETNKADLLPESITELSTLIGFLNEHPNASIEILGHTDNTGSVETNLSLSENRARSVYNYLIQNKISPERLSYKGLGSSQPVADNGTEEGRQANRRTEFRILKY